MSKSQKSTVYSPVIRVVMIEDDPVYRQFLRQVLKKIAGVDLIGEFGTAKEGVAACLRDKPEALLLDLHLPDQQGVEVVRTLRPTLPDMIVLLMTAHPRGDLPRELLKLGVQGFGDKTASSVELAKTIRSVLAGGLSYTSTAGLAKVAAEPAVVLPGDAQNVLPDVLTTRELQIAKLVAAALSSKEVATKLNLSTRTVEKHRANIHAKLGVRDVVGLTRWCMYHDLVK